MTTSAEFCGVRRWSVTRSRTGSLVICVLQWTNCGVRHQRPRFRARSHPRNPQSGNGPARAREIARSAIRTRLTSYAARGRSLRLRLEHVARELGSGPHADLAKDFVQVVLDGARSDEQLGCNLVVRRTLGHQLGDLRLLGRE